jgi:chemosensory pili system protein ChpA (sensor histidine kinase/response regulator)
MSSSTANVDLLSWVKAEIDHALSIVRERFASFLANSDDPMALRGCPAQLHQVSGALRMVRLEGAARICAAIEHAFAKAAEGKEAGKTTISTIDSAVNALGQFLDDLSKGEPNVPLKLFPVYREVMLLQGKFDAAEKDLFFPDLSVEAPAGPVVKAISGAELKTYLQAQRTRFQRGMLAWLRNVSDGQGPREMRLALDAICEVSQQLPAARALWWTATGLIDGLIVAQQPAWIASTKIICSRIDLQLRDLVAGTASGNEPLLRDVLYAIATCQESSQRIKEVRQLFKLDSQFPEPTVLGLMEYDMDRVLPVLNDMRSRLDGAKNAWVQYTSGEARALTRFRELAAALKTRANDLDNQHLVRLFDVVVFIAARLPDPYPQQQQIMIVEMAAAFLLAEHILENFTAPLPDLDQQVKVMAGWLLDAAKGKTRSGEPPAGLRADLTQQISDIQLRAQVAKEIHANLQLIEQGLDSFARDSAQRENVRPLAPLLKQIHGALAMLGLKRAGELLEVCYQLIVECIKPGNQNLAEDMDWIAEGLSSLGLFLDPMLRGHPPSERAIDTFFARLKTRSPAPASGLQESTPQPQPAAPAVEIAAEAKEPDAGPSAAMEPAHVAAYQSTDAVATPVEAVPEIAAPPEAAPETDRDTVTTASAEPPVPTAADRNVDPELLDIFLEEADEVLANIGKALSECRAQPSNLEALTTIRRSFHTLKGSGRMVGLDDLGEIAWEIEKLLNHWLEQHIAVTPGLIDFIARASAAFAVWIGRLKSRLQVTVDGRDLVALAHELKNTSQTDAEAASAPQPVEVIIGDTRLSRSFYEIYLKEAGQHLAILDAEFAAWSETRGQEVSHEFMRSVHTLAGISRTTGFTGIADLASALEQWLPYASRVVHDEQMQIVQTAIVKLRAMIDDVARQQPPQAAETELQNLQHLVILLQAANAQHAPPAHATAAASPQAEAIALGKAIAAAKPKDQRVIRDDLDPDILPIFLEEAETLVPQIGHDLREWKAQPENYALCHALQRSLHTLKGSARMVGAMRLGELIHLMESKVETGLAAEALPPELFGELETEMDRLSEGIERIHHPPVIPEEERAEVPSAAAVAAAAAEVAPRIETPLAGPVAMLRINADTLDRLINESSEISIARSRLEGELRMIKQSLSDLNESVTQLRNQLREVELQADSQMQSRRSLLDEKDQAFDPLEFDRYTQLQELTRLMAEGLHDVTSIQQNLVKTLGDADAAVIHQSRINRGLQQELMRMRTVPFATLSERLYRTVRQTARELDKRANLEIEGGQVELDRSVLERIGAPLEHMLRNAVAHGLERAADRAAAGKREIGEIRIALRHEGNEIVILMSDDGGGIDVDRLGRKAVEKGLLKDGQEVREAELIQLIFASGLSTTEEITELAGRGVGMDVVRNEIAALGGRVEVATRRGKDTTFTIYLPLTLAVTQAVLVRAGGDLYAIPSAMVEQVLKLKHDALAQHYRNGAIEAQGTSYPLHYLRRLLRKGGAAATDVNDRNAVLLLRSGIQHVAVHVDELLKNQEIVVKNLGLQLARVVGIAGATVLGDGRIVMIINPVLLSQRPASGPVAEPVVTSPVAAGPVAPTVMVVDDSLTVRKITSKLLEREGYRVTTAKDGVDALEQLKDELPDLMLVDIEMPRMDGFDLAKSIRNDQRTREIPIIIISSRTAEKHRKHAEQCGVDDFLGKPYQESELLRHIETLIARKKQAPNPQAALH